MKNEIVSFLSEAGHSISGYEHKILEKFAAFMSKANEPVVETPAPVVAVDPAPVAVEAPAEVTAGNSTNTEDK